MPSTGGSVLCSEKNGLWRVVEESVDPSFLKEKIFYLQADFCFHLLLEITLKVFFLMQVISLENFYRNDERCCVRKGTHLFVFFH